MSKEQVARDIKQAAWIKLAWIVAWLGGCTYMVFWRGVSGWWYALAIFLAMSFRFKVRDDDTGEIAYDSAKAEMTPATPRESES